MSKPQFSLQLFFVLFTALILFVGISTIRRKQILREVEQFETEGVTLQSKNEWIDLIWMRRPTEATINIRILPSLEKRIGKHPLTTEYFDGLVARLKAKQVKWYIVSRVASE